MIDSREELEENLHRVIAGVEHAARRVGREPSGVTLVAITKTVPAELVSWAASAGVSNFGENYVKELIEKRALAPGATWHYVGTLQSHTVNRVADHADVVHSAVPGRALRRLARRAKDRDRVVPVLVQIDETFRRSGVRPDQAERAVAEIHQLDGVTPTGLMTLPPEPRSPEDSRPFFRRLRELRDDLQERFPGVVELSMGMSMDYEIAVEEGASMVRVGTALFGARPPAPGT